MASNGRETWLSDGGRTGTGRSAAPASYAVVLGPPGDRAARRRSWPCGARPGRRPRPRSAGSSRRPTRLGLGQQRPLLQPGSSRPTGGRPGGRGVGARARSHRPRRRVGPARLRAVLVGRPRAAGAATRRRAWPPGAGSGSGSGSRHDDLGQDRHAAPRGARRGPRRGRELADREAQPLALLVDVVLEQLDVGCAAARGRPRAPGAPRAPGCGPPAGPGGPPPPPRRRPGRWRRGRRPAAGRPRPRRLASVRAACSSASRMAASAVRWASTSVRFSVSSASPIRHRRAARPPRPRRSASADAALGGGDPLAGLAQLRVLAVDGHGQALEELVDVLGVVAAALGLAELGVVQHLRRSGPCERW